MQADTHGALVVTPAPPDEDDDTLRGHEPAAWEDSDDERLTVSLAGDARLRKLRVSAAEDLVDGREYTKRLRRQCVDAPLLRHG